MNHRTLRRTPQINLLALLMLGAFLMSCAPRLHYPKIITLGYVNAGLANAGFEISVLDLNKGIRQYVTNSQGIAPSSYSYCETKQQVVYSAPVEDGEELIFEDLTNYRTEALTQGNNHFKLPVWSSDCSMLAFTSFDGDPNVLLLNPKNSQTQPAISQQEISSQDASWSPDSHFLATYIPVPSPNNKQQKYDLGIVDTTTNKLTTRIGGSIAYPFSGVTWNSDSNTIYYSVMRDASSFDIYMFDLNSNLETPLIQTQFHDVQPMLSPDGKYLSFLQASSNQATYLVGLLNLSSRNIEMMATGPMAISASLWLDNQHLLLLEYDPFKNQTIYYALNIQNKAIKEISRFDGRFTNPKILQP